MKKLILFLALCCATAFAQTDSGSVRVLVTDSSNGAVAEAKVTLSNVATGIVIQRDSTSEGYATFTPVTRGSYVGVANSGLDPKMDRLPFLNVSAFQVQALNTPGNSARNPAIGPGLFAMNQSLVKRFSLTERISDDLRFEAFNAFNNVNFANPNTSFGTAAFGQITSAGDPRVTQAAVRFRF